VLTIKSDGTLELKEKVRGREAALKQMVSNLKQSVNAGLDTVFIPHTDCGADALSLAEMVKAEVGVKKIEIIAMGPVIGAHVGPGAIALVYEADITRKEYESKSGK
jgi:fatty acid-binding protein DegV